MLNKEHPMRPQLVFLALPLLLAACASEAPPPPPRPAPVVQAPAAPAPSAINAAPPGLDGRWVGEARLQPGQARTCTPSRIPTAMTVNQGRAALAFGRGQTLEGTITSDGMINFANGVVSAQGTFQGRGMLGEASREGCVWRLNLRKR